MPWTDEQREEAKELYEKEKPTPENTTEIVKQVAEAMGQTPNGVRMILNKQKVYIKAVGAKTPSKANGGGTDNKPKRVSKADSADALIKALEAEAVELSDDDLATIGRMTGKATIMIESWIATIVGDDEDED